MKHPIYNPKWIIGNIWIATERGKDGSTILRGLESGFNINEFQVPIKIASKIEKTGWCWLR